ncbi:hypothetical protein APHAL10511_005633 [Amanita phalloides]|nr:hypothetical protein APHAL10511_005633 [Amanita phalloides]
MIRVDRNLQESVSLLPESHLSWQPNDTDFIQRLDPKDQSQLHPPSPAELPRDRSSSLSPAPDTNSPQTQPEAPSSPPLTSNAQEKEEPVKASRLSTPLNAPSELLAPQKSSETAISSPAVSSVTHLPVSPTSSSTDPKSAEHKVISILDLNSELLQVCIEFQKKGIHPTDALYLQFSQRLQSNLAWLAAIADPKMTTVSLPMIDPPPTVDFYPCQRIQQLYTEIPGFFAKEIARRQQLGIPLIIPGSGFIQALNPAHKRERTDDGSPDPVSKRQNTGDGKPPTSQLMPPPSSIPSTNSSPTPNLSVSSAAAPQMSGAQPISNGHGGPSPPAATHQHFPQHLPQQSNDAHLMMAQAGMPQQPSLNSQEVQMAARVRQAQLRMAQQQQQQAMANAKQAPTGMHGASNTSPKGVGPSMALTAAGGGATGQVGHVVGNANPQHGITIQQALQILQNPNHPIMQYLMRAIPGFQGFSQQVQVQKIATAAIQMQKQSDQQRAAGAGMPNVQQMQNTAGGAQTINPGAVPGAGGMSGINMNNLNPHQRQLLLMQQQQRGGGNMAMGNAGMAAGLATGVSGSGSSAMMINPQQMALSPQQIQQQQQQRMGGGMSVNMGSPMSGGANDFAPALRSNNTIPGIARSARSPSETSPNPMTPRGGNAVGRGASMGPEDYQRMMMKQQQQGQNSQGTIFGTPGGATQGMMGGNWAGQQGGGIAMGQSQGQNQNLHLQGMQMQGGYGMSSPIQAQHQPQQHQQAQSTAAGLGTFIGGVASPPPMGVSSPNWAGSPTQQQGGGIGGMFSPFSPTGGSLADISRHMSATLGSHQSQTSSLAGSQDDYSGLFDWPS